MNNPNPNAKLTDFTFEQLSLAWMAFEALKIQGVFEDQAEDIQMWKVQIMNAINSVKSKEKVNQN